MSKNFVCVSNIRAILNHTEDKSNDFWCVGNFEMKKDKTKERNTIFFDNYKENKKIRLFFQQKTK